MSQTAKQTAKQRKCPHPYQHVHPTYDPRWEVCDLCKLISPRPIPAPWIAAHDAAQPTQSAPDLFTQPAPEPAKAKAKKARHAARMKTDTADHMSDAMSEADVLARDDALTALADEPTPPLDPSLAIACHRCGGSGRLADPDAQACPRCEGNGQIYRYTA